MWWISFLFASSLNFRKVISSAAFPNPIDDYLEKTLNSKDGTKTIYLKELKNFSLEEKERIVEKLAEPPEFEKSKKVKLIFEIPKNIVSEDFSYLNRLLYTNRIDLSVSIPTAGEQFWDEPWKRDCESTLNSFLDKPEFLTNVLSIKLSYMALKHCPKIVYSFKSLKSLILDGNDFRKGIFEDLDLPYLEVLSFKECQIGDFSLMPDDLPMLKELICDKSRIKNFKTLPSGFKHLELISMTEMPCLEEVDLAITPKMKGIYLWQNKKLVRLILNVTEDALNLERLTFVGSPIKTLICTANLNQLKKTKITATPPPDMFMCLYHGDKLRWDELHRLKKRDAAEWMRKDEIFMDRNVVNNPQKKLCWNKGVFESCVFDLNKNSLGQDELLGLWNIIVIRAGINILNGQNPNYDSSIRYLRNLYGEKIEDDDNWINFTYAQYRPTMQALLSELFKTIGSSSLDQLTLKTYVESILGMFQRPQGEQLVYFYHLLKSLSKEEGNELRFQKFIHNSIVILKDYIFTMTVNLEGYNQKLLDEFKTRAKDLGLKPDNEIFGLEKNDEKYEKEILPLFCSKFSPEWFIQIISGALNFDENLNNEFIKFLNDGHEDSPKYCDTSLDGVRALLLNMKLISEEAEPQEFAMAN